MPCVQIRDPCTNCLDHACYLITNDHRGLRAVRIQALTGEHIGEIDPNSLHGNTHCPSRNIWLGHVVQA